METEIWKDIQGYEGLYKVSNLGNIYSIKRSKILGFRKNKKGYNIYYLSKLGKQLNFLGHRLVALHFISIVANKYQVNHINGIRDDNRVENLEWVTQSENQLHAFKNNLQISKKGKDHPMYGKYGKLNKRSKPITQYSKEGIFIKNWESTGMASIETLISRNRISACLCKITKTAGGFIWKYL